MDVDVDGFASPLAARLAAIVPDGFHVELAGDMLWFRSDQGRFPGQLGDYTQGPVYHGQLRMLDVKSTGANLTADSRVLLTVGTTGATTCESLQITPDGKTAVCATQYYKAGAGSGNNAGCANGGLKFTAFPLPATRPSRVLYQNRGACNNGYSFTLWTDSSASSIIGVTWINPHGAGGREAVQIGVITGGHFRPLNIATSVPPETYPNLAF